MMGLNIITIKGKTKVLPKNAIPSADHDESALSPQKDRLIPKGIAPLSSKTGINDSKNVASRTLPSNISTKNCDKACVIIRP